MVDETCECCDTVANGSGNREREPGSASEPVSERGADPSRDRWIDDSPVTEAPLPDDVRGAMERFVGDGPIATLEDWIRALRTRFGGSIDVDDLCHADEETAHWGELDGTRYYFRCFYDAVALAELASESVDVRTASPDGTVIEARATGTGDVEVTPSTAAVSFGVATDGATGTGEPTLEDAYATICPTVRAFPTRSAYEEWAARTPAATVGMPVSAAIPVATGLVE